MHHFLHLGFVWTHLSSLLVFAGVGWLALIESARAQSVTFSLVAISGEAAPGTTAGTTFQSVFSPVINIAGDVAFLGVLEGASVSETANSGLWLQKAGVTELVVRKGDVPPDVPAGGEYNSLNEAVLGVDGTLAFGAGLRGFDSGLAINDGVFSRAPSGVTTMVARSGQTAPGVPAGAVFGSFTSLSGFSSAGEVAFEGVYKRAGEFDSALYRGSVGSLTAVVQRGTEAESGAFSFGTQPVISPEGAIIFEGLMDVGEGENGIFEAPAGGGEIATIAYENDQPPGLPSGVFYGSNFRRPVLAGNGHKLFFAQVTGTGTVANDHALFTNRSGTLAPLVRTGGAAAGFPDGVTYVTFDDYTINAAGQVLFSGNVAGPGITSANDNALWLVDASGTHLLLRQGTAVTLGRAGLRTPLSFFLTKSSLNDAGVAVVQVNFSGGVVAIVKVARAVAADSGPDAAPPELTIRGGKKKRTFTGQTITLRGTIAAGDGSVRVEGRVKGSRKILRSAPGAAWKLKFRVIPGKKTIILVRAVDSRGNASAFQRVTFQPR